MKQTISEKEFERQLREASKKAISEPDAIAVHYENGKVFVELASGWNFDFNPRDFEEFASATEADLETIGLWGRYTLACPNLDVHIGIGSIILKLIGEKFLVSELSRRRGQTKSKKKQNASRANGKLGGRPKKVAA
ncbi:MAG: DUF2442 domain-containing protein [Pyrinomonadaceae bacterium]|nr:DUF2442 domain-containing protein [Pyrinomonadaceae bacterium]